MTIQNEEEKAPESPAQELTRLELAQLVSDTKEQERLAMRRGLILTAIPLLIGVLWLGTSMTTVRTLEESIEERREDLDRLKKEVITAEKRKAEALVAVRQMETQFRTLRAQYGETLEVCAPNLPTQVIRQARQTISATTNFTENAAAVVPSVIIVGTEAQRAPAASLRKALEDKGFKVAFGPLGSLGKPPTLTEVRYFRVEKRPDAEEILSTLQARFSIPSSRVAFVVNPAAPGNQFEVWLDSSALNVSTSPQQSESIPIVGRGFTPEEFVEYVNSLSFDKWKPSFAVLHYEPTWSLEKWHQRPGEKRLAELAAFLGGVQRWKSGPHLLIDDKRIWVLSPLTQSGTHSPSWNRTSLGIEMVGNYEIDPLDPSVRDNTVAAIATIYRALGLEPASLRLHREDPRANAACPGKNVDKDDLVTRVSQQMGQVVRPPGETR